MNTSLMAIMRDDPDLSKRLEQGTKEVRQSKKQLMSAAATCNEQYEAEIAEGTRKRQLLLECGRREGKTESEVLASYGQFLPTRQTPILNFLFFLMRDGEKPDWLGIHKQLNEDYKQVNTVVANAMSEDELDQVYGVLVHEDERYANVKEPNDMDTYIYGSCTHAMFVRIKKLKALSTSANQNEAFLAYRLCHKLCKKYGLEFDKIPCNVGDNE